MKNLITFSLASLICFLTLLFQARPLLAAFDPPAYFEKKCSSCHTVGGGKDVGPDLKGVETRRSEDWLIRMIQSSQDLIKSGDPVAVELFNKFKKKKMPDTELSAGDIRKLLAFIKKGGPAEKPIDLKPATEATPADVDLGRKLYLGTQSFAKGAPACISCHSTGNFGALGGGTLGPDLTQVYARYEDKGLSKALVKMGFPIMQEIYATKPLTPDEAFALKAFFFQADKEGSQDRGYQKKFVFLGLAGMVLGLGVIDLSWRKRRKKSAKPRQGGLS